MRMLAPGGPDMEKRMRSSYSRSVIAARGRRVAVHLLLLGALASGCASTPPAAPDAGASLNAPAPGADAPVPGSAAARRSHASLLDARSADAVPWVRVAAIGTPADVAPNVVEPGGADARAIEPTVVEYPPPRDPLMPLNRAIFAFNDVAYRYVLIPLGRGYVRITSEPVRASIGNFFRNLRTPISAANQLFQGRPREAGRSLARFGINTTIGLLGLFDPASTIGFEPQKTDFDQTLAGYGAGQGVYLVLPLIGPSDTRDAAGLVVDYFLNPVHYLADGNEERWLRASDTFQQFAPTGDEYETIRAKAEDPYIFFRNLYWQGVRRDLEY